MNISLINVNLKTLITEKPGLGASSCILYNSSPISELSTVYCMRVIRLLKTICNTQCCFLIGYNSKLKHLGITRPNKFIISCGGKCVVTSYWNCMVIFCIAYERKCINRVCE